MCLRCRSWFVVVVWCVASVCCAAEVSISVRDEHGKPAACHIRLLDSDGKAHHPEGLPFWNRQFACLGDASLSLPPGKYTAIISRGPEYRIVRRVMNVGGNSSTDVDAQLERISKVRSAGWYSADLHIHRSPEDVELLARAADLDFAPVITWWNRRNLWQGEQLPKSPLRKFDGHRLMHVMTGEDEREGGALLYFRLDKPLNIAQATREVPSPLAFVDQAKQRSANVWIDIEKPFWWDVPTWLASGQMQSIGLANNHLLLDGMLENEAWGRPRDAQRLPPPQGNGEWSQMIYHHILSAGLRIPPSAGSASGVLANPVGYNRVFVHVDGEFTQDTWWDGLAAGRCFVTNGPLLTCRANGELPGHEFPDTTDSPLDVQLRLLLSSNDRVKQIEVIHNGNVIKAIPCSNETSQSHSVDVRIPGSGWFLVRAVADVDYTYRFASTGPFYVQLGDEPHISRASCQFFVDWVNERIARILNNIAEQEQREQVLGYHYHALEFWKNRLDHATAP